MAPSAAESIKVLQPRLPEAALLAPYLARIDAARIYSNFGPLLVQFESRLAQLFGLTADGVTTVANGTLALTLALKAQQPKPGSLCIMPSWTFAATAHAVRANGLVPYFIDVERDTWALDPVAVLDAAKRAPASVGAVVPVVPFGCPFNYAAWDQFAEQGGLPVAIDAAAAFDTVVPGTVPLAISMHATKCLGIGEGGLVVCRDSKLVNAVRRLSAFGFEPGSRDAQVAAINAKLSEYAAAVGLAALDVWPYTRIGLTSLARTYGAVLAGVRGMSLMPGLDSCFAASTYTIVLDRSLPPASEIAARMRAGGIETRRWWGEGCHAQPAFAQSPRADLSVTYDLAQRALGLPFHLGLKRGDLTTIASVLTDALVSDARPVRAAS